MDAGDKSLLDVDYISLIEIEYTSECNLRCTYCPVSQPGYVGRHMSDVHKETIIDLVRAGKVRGYVHLNAVGETTFAPGWVEYSRRLRAFDNIKVRIFTNLGRDNYSPEEFDELSRLERVHFSLDTIDNAVLKRTRRKVSSRIVGHNITMMRASALREHRKPPTIVCNAMMNDLSARGAEDLVYWSRALSVDEVHFFGLYESVRGEYLPGAENVGRLDQMTSNEAGEARESIRRAIEALDGFKMPYWIDHNIQNFLNDRSAYSEPLAPGMTRDCALPWETMIVKANGAIPLCCVEHGEQVGTLSDGPEALERFNAAMRDVRAELLAGELRPNCASCQFRTPIEIEKHRRRIEQQFGRRA